MKMVRNKRGVRGDGEDLEPTENVDDPESLKPQAPPRIIRQWPFLPLFLENWLLSRYFIYVAHLLTYTWILIYFMLILRYGTISPFAVYTLTVPYNQPPVDAPPPDWKPSSRVVVSLTTMPHHLSLLNDTLLSLLRQSLTPDAIYLSLPKGRNPRSGQEHDPNYTAPPGITILRPETDYGPLTKLLPAVQHETDPSTIIITVDDDQIYQPDVVRYLAWYSEQYKSVPTAFGFCGWGFMAVPLTEQRVTPVYVPYIMRGDSGRKVEVLQACCGNAYRKGFFGEDLKDIAQGCFTTDDLWIAGYLMHRNVSRVVVPLRQDIKAPEWKKREKSWRLSDINNSEAMDIKCIRGVQNKYSGSWNTSAHLPLFWALS